MFFSCPLIKNIHTEHQLFPGFHNSWGIFEDQKNNLFDQKVFEKYDNASHQSKQAFRFTIPLLAHIFHLRSIHVYILQVVLGIVQFLFIGLIVYDLLKDKFIALMLMLSYCFIYCGYMSFTQFGGVFDGISIFFLLAAIYFRNHFFTVFFLLLAYFNDERSVLVGLILAAIIFINPPNFLKNKSFYYFFFSLIFYAIIRLLLGYYFGLHTPSGANTGFDLYVLSYNFNGMAFAGRVFLQLEIMMALDGFWIILILYLFQKKQKHTLLKNLILVFSALPLLLVCGMVYDTQRSLAYLFPAIILLLVYIDFEKINFKQLSIIILICCFIIPSHPMLGLRNSVGPANYLPYVLYDFFYN